MGVGEIRYQGNGLSVNGDGVFKPAKTFKGLAQIVEAIGIAGVQLKGAFHITDSLIAATFLKGEDAQ